MLPCDKRQTVVNRSTGNERYRCVNRKCDAYGHDVDSDACSVCPVRVYAKLPPCKQARSDVEIPQQPVDITDDEVRELIDQLPEGEADLAEMQASGGTEATPDFPALSLQLWLYKQALIRWNSAGRPVRSQEEVEEILEKKCKPCEWYDKGRCRGCGCRVSSSSFAVINKIKMATENCPKGEW